MKHNQQAAYFKISKKPTNIKIAAGKIIKNDIPQRKVFVSENITNEETPSENMITSTEQSLRELVDGLKNIDREQKVFDIKIDQNIQISPLAKKIAEVEGLTLEDIPVTSGRIEKKDVMNALKRREAAVQEEVTQEKPEAALPQKVQPALSPAVSALTKSEKLQLQAGKPNGDTPPKVLKGKSAPAQDPSTFTQTQPVGDNQTDKTPCKEALKTQLQHKEHQTKETAALHNLREQAEKTPKEKTMLEDQSPIIHLTTEVDMTEIKELRKHIAKKIEKETGLKCTYTDFLLMSVAKALVENPRLNGYYDDFKRKAVQYKDVQLGLSAANEKGQTIFPTIRKAQDLNFTQMLTIRSDLLKRVKKGALTQEETAPTFAIANLGMYGILEFSSRIQRNNAAILSVGKVVDRLRVVGNEQIPRAVMHLNLNLDTRVCDGIMGAQFLKTVVDTMENPAVLLF